MATQQNGFDQWGRKQVSVGNISGLDSRGMNTAFDAQTQYLNGLGALTKSIGNFANTYMDIINERKTRDADTEISTLFRNQRMDVFTNIKGKDADELINKQDEWQKKAYEEFAQKSDAHAGILQPLWKKYADQHLDRMGAYQVEQQAQYDKQSRLASAEAGLDKLMDTRIGDMTGVQEYFKHVEELFPNDPNSVEVLKAKGIETAVKGWGRLNASATLQWFKQNGTEIKGAIGKDFVKVSDIMHSVESQLNAELSRSEMLAARSERLARQRQKDADDRAYGTYIDSIVTSKFGPEDAYKLADDQSISGDTKVKIYGFAKTFENDEFKEASGAKLSGYLTDAYTGQMDEVKYKRVQEDVLAGQMTPEQFKTITTAKEAYESSVSTETKPMVDAVGDYLKNIYAPSNGLLGPADPGGVAKYQKMQLAVVQYAKGKTAKQLADDLDFNNPDSWVNKAIKLNGFGGRPAPMQGIDLNWSPNTNVSTAPSAAGTSGISSSTTVKERQPGESFNEYRKRTGK